MSDRAIETLLDEERRFPPDPAFTAQANAQPDLYQVDPGSFWADQARERVTWLEGYSVAFRAGARRAEVEGQRPFTLGAGPTPGYCVSLDPSARERLRGRLEADLPRQADGSISLPLRAWAIRSEPALAAE